MRRAAFAGTALVLVVGIVGCAERRDRDLDRGAGPSRPIYTPAGAEARDAAGGDEGAGLRDPGATAPGSIRFAVIGDYGNDSDAEALVAKLVVGWDPEFVITTGDNNYYEGSAATIDVNIGKYYARFIGDYTGAYGPGSPANRFWPSAGNHDWGSPDLAAYRSYFTLPGNERYYDVDLGLVHLYAVDSIEGEPDGTNSTSKQALWLKGQLGRSTSCWDVVYFHYPAYSSGSTHGSTYGMRWPFEAWGADVVMAGHDHVYERLSIGGIPYFTVGLGGVSKYAFLAPLPESRFRYAADFGALRVTADRHQIRYEFFDTRNTLVDAFVTKKECL